MIMTDTQRCDMLGCYGNAGMHTPSLDRLSAEGMRFTSAYCCQPVCGPARAALFTGLYPHACGGWANSMDLGENTKTIGQRLHDQGIAAAYVGKWHLDGGDYFGMGRCPQGWDEEYWYDMRNYLEELSEEERRRSRQVKTNREGISADFTFGHRCSNRAIDYLQRHAGDDFLLVLSYDEPHGPHLCPEPFASMYADYDFPKSPAFFDDLSGKPEHQRLWGEHLCRMTREEREAYVLRAPDFFGCNSFIDSEIGRVLAAINAHAPEAMVIYTADHGDMLNHHSLYGKGPAMYEEITNIPLLVRWRGQTPAGAVCEHPVSHINVAPTLLDYFQLPRPPLLNNAGLLPCLADPAQRVNDAVFMEFGRYEVDHDGFGGFQPIRSIFDGRYKLVVNLISSDELYDLTLDPHELSNRIDVEETVEIRDALHDRLLQWMDDTRDPFRGYCWQQRRWRRKAPPASWANSGMTRQREEDPRYEPRQLDYDTGVAMKEAVRRK